MSQVILKTPENTATWTVEDDDGDKLWGVFMQVFKGVTPVVTAGNVGGPAEFGPPTMANTGPVFLDRSSGGGLNIDDLIEELKDRQNSVCAYGTREGDGMTCDCKYTDRMLLGEAFELRGERTGCCELRSAVQILEKMK